MDSCDRRTHAYKNGKTFEQCMEIAETMNIQFQKDILENGKILWTELLEKVDHDELVYKLSLKYLSTGVHLGTSGHSVA